MFAVRGLLLFAAVGLAFSLAFALVTRWAPRLARAVALVLAALALHSASTLGWGAADVPDGTRYKASPVGLSHILTPNQLTSTTVDCGWYSASGYTTPCRVAAGGESDFRKLRAVYPLVITAMALCALAAVMSAATAHRIRRLQRPLAIGVAFTAVLSVIVFSSSFGDALADLSDLSVGTGGTLGTMELTAAVLLCLVAGTSPRRESLANTLYTA
jgi:hypothetical protein